MPSWFGIFHFGAFLSVALSDSRYMCTTWPSSSRCISFFMLIVHAIMFFLFPYLTLELFYSLCIQLLVWLSALSINLLVEFSFIILECSVLFILLDPVLVSFKSLFFCLYLLIYLFLLNCKTCLMFLFRSFHANISLYGFPSFAVSFVAPNTLHDLLISFPNLVFIILFSTLLSISYNPSLGPRPSMRKCRDYMYSMFHFLFRVLLFQS